ncbi:unnamed protein product, partial [Fusarium fujikuroi]
MPTSDLLRGTVKIPPTASSKATAGALKGSPTGSRQRHLGLLTMRFWGSIQLLCTYSNCSVLGFSNPLGLGRWLTQQCLATGVKIMLNSEILGVELSTLNELQAISLRINGQQKTTIVCKQLVLACGPWTPAVYEKLFPSAPVHLQWTTNAGGWIMFKNPCLTIPESTAFV